jgi:hypothetical protein
MNLFRLFRRRQSERHKSSIPLLILKSYPSLSLTVQRLSMNLAFSLEEAWRRLSVTCCAVLEKLRLSLWLHPVAERNFYVIGHFLVFRSRLSPRLVCALSLMKLNLRVQIYRLFGKISPSLSSLEIVEQKELVVLGILA